MEVLILRKTYCDSCGKEIEHTYSFDPLTHIVGMAEGNGRNYYVDTKDWNPVSGRIEHYDLCLGCYNNVYTAAYEVIKLTRETVKSKKENA